MAPESVQIVAADLDNMLDVTPLMTLDDLMKSCAELEFPKLERVSIDQMFEDTKNSMPEIGEELQVLESCMGTDS